MIDFPYKTQIPQYSSHLVSRNHLIALLASISERRVLTISAPAGYGKTSLLTNFTHQSPLPVCWYSLDSVDQDSWIFLEYLTNAIGQRFVGATVATEGLLQGCGRSSLNS